MIKLQIAKYCQNCPEFEPRLTKDEQNLTSFDMRSRSYVDVRCCDTTITCEHAARCQTIRDYIQREVKKEK